MAQQRKTDVVGDALQYVPRASVLVLRLCGVESKTKNDKEYFARTIGSTVLSTGIVWGLKSSINSWRPDHTDQRSFPSGHSAMAFGGAHLLHKEYGQHSPWISIGGYAVAATVAVSRVARDRHHWYDVTAGAAIGILSTELVYFSTKKLFPHKETTISMGSDCLTVNVRF